MTDRALLQQALEAASDIVENYTRAGYEGEFNEAITALRERLAREEQPEIDWKDQYEKQKRRADMWVAKYEADIGPLEKAGPVTAQQEPVTWKLVLTKPTHEMLKAMDECSTEGYDERLYAGHAASVYMAAVDVAPTPSQRKPLTNAEIRKWWASENGFEDCNMAKLDDFEQVIRAVEGKHGIKENT